MAVFGKGRGKKQFSSKASLAFYEVDEYRKKLKKQIEEEESEMHLQSLVEKILKKVL